MVKREKSINEIDVKCLVFDLLLFRALHSGQRGCNISGRLLGYAVIVTSLINASECKVCLRLYFSSFSIYYYGLL